MPTPVNTYGGRRSAEDAAFTRPSLIEDINVEKIYLPGVYIGACIPLNWIVEPSEPNRTGLMDTDV